MKPTDLSEIRLSGFFISIRKNRCELTDSKAGDLRWLPLRGEAACTQQGGMRILLGVLASLAVASAAGGHTNLRRSEQCSDSCRHNFDGDCDDGGTGAEYVPI